MVPTRAAGMSSKRARSRKYMWRSATRTVAVGIIMHGSSLDSPEAAAGDLPLPLRPRLHHVGKHADVRPLPVCPRSGRVHTKAVLSINNTARKPTTANVVFGCFLTILLGAGTRIELMYWRPH